MNIVRVHDLYNGNIVDIAVSEVPTECAKGDYVIIKDAENQEAMAAYIRGFEVHDTYQPSTLEFLRKATPHDTQKIESLVEKNENALTMFMDKIEEFGCSMTPIAAYYSFNNKNIHFVFTAPERVDFRDLLKELVGVFKKKIFLEQIGPKDRAKLFGGYGKCGREQCCSTFLQALPSVTMDAVRKQHLMYKSSSKLLGACGKLLCCLTYEIEVYKELASKFPPLGSIVSFERHKGEIISMDILNQTVRVLFEKTSKIEMVSIDKIKVVQAKETQNESDDIDDLDDRKESPPIIPHHS